MIKGLIHLVYKYGGVFAYGGGGRGEERPNSAYICKQNHKYMNM